MRDIRTLVLVCLVILGGGFAVFLSLPSIGTASPVSVHFLGKTNGIIGITNGSWIVYVVTNHSADPYLYAGVRIELKSERGWALDDSLKPTELGWVAPPNRVWHDAFNAGLPSGGSFHVFFNTEQVITPWRASLKFVRDRPSSVPASLRANPGILAGLAVDALEKVDRRRLPIDCPVPQAGNVTKPRRVDSR